MKDTHNDLRAAQTLFARQKYGQIISQLTPQIVLYRKDPAFYTILGFSCLYTEDFGGAYSYLKRARDLAPENVSVFLGLAVVMLRRRKLTEALNIWLQVLELDPKNKRAKRALDMARTFSENDWLQLIEKKKYSSILPAQRSLVLSRIIPWTVAGLLLVALLVVIISAISGIEPPYRVNSELLEFDRNDYTPGDYSQFAAIIFTDAELERKVAEIKYLFHHFQDNLIRYHGNTILMSNAPLGLKDRISFIMAQLQVPNFTNFQDNFEYTEVAENPQFYNGVYVRWRGRVANFSIADDFIIFDLLVGFDDGRIVQGTVPVILDFAVNLRGGEAVEVIARVSSEDGTIRLSATSIRLIIQ